MDNSNHHIVFSLFLTGILCACGSGTSSPSGPEAAVTAAEIPAVPTSELLLPPPNTELSPATQGSPSTQESPDTTLTLSLSPNSTRPAKTNIALCNDSLFLDDVSIPDGTILAPGQDFTKTWRLTNTGICGWTTSYAIGYAYGEVMSGIDTKLPKSIAAGGTLEISVKMTAPLIRGWYGGWWRLKDESGNYFGDFVYVSILVVDGQETSTPFS